MRYLLALVAITPLVTFAAPKDFKSLLGVLTDIISYVIPLIFALTFITIAWGVVKAWIMGDATESDVERGKKVALAGVIALVVMVSIWGIIRLLQQGIFG